MDGPEAICVCGHTGRGLHSQHGHSMSHYAVGCGVCLVDGCGCLGFEYAADIPRPVARSLRVRLLASELAPQPSRVRIRIDNETDQAVSVAVRIRM